MIRNIYITNRFFIAICGLIVLMIVSYGIPGLFPISKLLVYLFITLLIVDIFVLFRKRKGVLVVRSLADRLSNGDENDISLSLDNRFAFDIDLEIIDEVPHQFQRRDISWEIQMARGSSKTMVYQLKPLKRGKYDFGTINVYVSWLPGLIKRRFRFDQGRIASVYPSIIQMRKFELAAFTNNLTELGVKKVRRIGQTMEFEQIKDYVIGDDPRNINWKASARDRELKVNHYQDERSQPIYTIVDKGRLMRMPFEGLSLLDYSINAALVILNIALKKSDKAGLITFSDKMSSVIKAENRPSQILKILETLHAQKTKYKESNFELLSAFTNNSINQRSLLLLFTNFESFTSFKRHLPYFIGLAKRHLLVVIFFRNTGLKEMINADPDNVQDIYTQIIAEQNESDKYLIVRELKKYGIFSILTTPENLSVDTINKYLEIKARGLM